MADRKIKHPFLSRIATYILHEDVYGASLSKEDVIDLINSLPIEYWIKIASLGRIFLEYYESSLQHQNELFRALVPKSLSGKYPGFFFHRTQFMILLRLALIHGTSMSKEIVDDERRDIVAHCLLGISSLLNRKNANLDSEDKINQGIRGIQDRLRFFSHSKLLPYDKRFIMGLVQVYHNHLWENLNNILGRCKDMLIDIPEDPHFQPVVMSPNLLSETLEANVALTSYEYAAMAFAVIAYYISPDRMFKKGENFPVNREMFFSNATINKKKTGKFLNVIGQTRSEYLSKEDNPDMIDDFSNFMSKPLVRLDDSDNYFPASLTYLERLLDSALPWEPTAGIFNPILREYWGKVFEYYCHKICERIRDTSLIKPVYIPETKYGTLSREKSSCDAILVYGNKAVVLEFKIKAPSTIESIYKQSYDSFIHDINDLLLGDKEGDKAAKQINNTINAIISGKLQLPGISKDSIKAFFPVVVTLQKWPLGILIYDLLRKVVRDAGVLNLGCCGELEIWSCEEFEYIESILTSETRKPIDLPQLIKSKLLSDYNNIPMSMYLKHIYGDDLKMSEYLVQKREEMFQIALSTLALTK